MKLRTLSIPVYERQKPPRLATAAATDTELRSIMLGAWDRDARKTVREQLWHEGKALFEAAGMGDEYGRCSVWLGSLGPLMWAVVRGDWAYVGDFPEQPRWDEED